MSKERAFLVEEDWRYHPSHRDWFREGEYSLAPENRLFVQGYGPDELSPGMIIILRPTQRPVSGMEQISNYYWERIPTEESR